MNLELMKAGYPAAILPVERRLEYYLALDEDHVPPGAPRLCLSHLRPGMVSSTHGAKQRKSKTGITPA